MSSASLHYKQLVKRYFCVIGIGIFCLFLCIPFVLYYTDPLQLFRKSQFQNGSRLHGDMRVQAAGIINSFQFDSIILGTSMLENTSAKEASKKLGGKFFNLSLSGSNFFERSFVLKKALQKGLKNVVYSLDSAYLGCGEERNDFPTNTWAFLYDDSRVNDFRIYFQKKFILKFYNPLAHTSVRDVDRPNAWYDAVDHMSRFGGLKKWVEHIDNDQVHDFLLKELPKKASTPQNKDFDTDKASLKLGLAKKYIDDYILQHVRKYNNTKFYLLFPPYFRYIYADWAQHNYENFYIHQEIIKYIAIEASKYNNLFVFGFENDDFLDNIANYKDTVHYHYRYNSYFLDEIRAERHKITIDNINTYLIDAKNRALSFNISELNNTTQELIKKIHNGKYKTIKN